MTGGILPSVDACSQEGDVQITTVESLHIKHPSCKNIPI